MIICQSRIQTKKKDRRGGVDVERSPHAGDRGSIPGRDRPKSTS